MATRRIKSTINNKYVQPLKLSSRDIVVSPNADYNSILYRTPHRATSDADISVKLWGKFNTISFDGIQLIAYLHKNETITGSGSCIFNISRVDPSSWQESAIFSTSGVYGDGKFTASATQADLGSTAELDGDITLAIDVIITRRNKRFKSKIYLNHLGVYESVFKLRQDVEFLDLTKLDE